MSRERGIRTPGPLTVNGFQDRRIRPLCHLSVNRGANIRSFFKITIYAVNNLLLFLKIILNLIKIRTDVCSFQNNIHFKMQSNINENKELCHVLG